MIASGYVIWLLIRGIKTFTGLDIEDAIKQKSLATQTMVYML